MLAVGPLGPQYCWNVAWYELGRQSGRQGYPPPPLMNLFKIIFTIFPAINKGEIMEKQEFIIFLTTFYTNFFFQELFNKKNCSDVTLLTESV